MSRGSCLSQVLDRGAQAVARGAVLVRRRYLRVVPRSLPAALLAVLRALQVLDRVAQAGACLIRCLRRRDAAASGEEMLGR